MRRHTFLYPFPIDSSCTPSLFSFPFRVMAFWATPVTCIVPHICSKEMISQAHKDSMSTACQFTKPCSKGIICIQQCFLSVRAVLSY